MSCVMCRMEASKYFICFFLSLLLFQKSYSQNEFYFEVTFKDKGSAFSVSNPSAFLSESSIQKKIKRNVPVDFLDLPVDVQNIQALGAIADSITHLSKWRNSVLIKLLDTSSITQIRLIPEVQSVQYLTAKQATSGKKEQGANKFSAEINLPLYTYGDAYHQLEMIGGHFLHERGYRGDSMNIAIFDAGFNPHFGDAHYAVMDQLEASGQIKYKWDFLDHDNFVFEKNRHGSMVLSVMANNTSKIIGSAPKANYYLFITEDDNSETLLEEYNWLMAAERADSIGVDVINSSLGYYTFDDTTTSHTYKDMDGKTTLVSKAANIAARKGIFVVVSAGNEGQTSWHYILSPADADSVLAVGAVDPNKKHAVFSSYGPASDGDIKPNVAAQGQGTVITYDQNYYNTANGTSFSGPLLAGAIACLWQAFPQLSNLELKKEIEKSGSQYSAPDSILGYGIPSLMKIYMNLDSTDHFDFQNTFLVSLRSNPFTDRIGIELYSTVQQKLNFKLLDVSGRLIREENQTIQQNQYLIFGLGDLSVLSSGVYFFTAVDESGFSKVYKVIKE
ncbi:MAG: S8 family serine peptidase [Bacteroidetes bacterium]|nr:S8 family serine peptidase [Bacteroidota bacterium]